METRPFGRTGIDVSALVLGAGWVGGLLITADDETKRRAIRLCLDRGVNWIDTAASYGQGKSEEALGWLLEEIEDQPYLSTKVGLDPDRLDDIPGQIERSLEASLKRLRRTSVDLFQLHNPITHAGGERSVTVAQAFEAIDALERIKAGGLTRHIGITALGEIGPLLEVVESGRIESAQVYYNLLNPSAGRAVPGGFAGGDFTGLIDACVRHGVAVMNIRILAAGVLATDDRHGREVMITPTSVGEDERRARAVFEVLGAGQGTRAQAAIRFGLSQPGISCVVIGVETLAHLEEALDGAALGPLPRDALDRLDPLYATDFGRLSA